MSSTFHWLSSGSRLWSAAGGLTYGKLAGVDELYIARAAIWQQAVACCLEMAHGKLAGVDDLYIVPPAIRHTAGCRVVGT